MKMKMSDFGTEKPKTDEVNTKEEFGPPIPVEGKEHKNKDFDYSQWVTQSDRVFRAAMKTRNTLPNGLFEIELDNYGEPIYTKKDLITDELLLLDNTALEVAKEIIAFWDNLISFKKYGFSHRRGYLFYGEAGTGKTCIVKQVIKQIIDLDGVIINCSNNPDIITKGITRFRIIEPYRKLLCIFEDIDAIIHRWGEERILSLLDGENITDNVLNIATTNYPEKLDKRIVSRPRRFDRIIKIGVPNRSVREKYFKNKLKLDNKDITEYVDVSDGFSFASLSDLVISTKCFNLPLDEAVNRLKDLEKEKSSNEYYHSQVGFKV